MSEQDFELHEFDEAWDGERLDKALADLMEGLSRSQVQTLIRDGQVAVNGQVQKASFRLQDGDMLTVSVPIDDEVVGALPEDIPLAVLYEDDHVAVIDKPAGMVVHPSFGHASGTLVNAVLARWPRTASETDADRAGIVHRLDKETSGVIVIAKTGDALESLRQQFKDRTIHKKYIALVEGTPSTPEGRIDAPIGRDPNQRKRMAVVRGGREAVTEFHVTQLFANHSLVEVSPHTGRTHQIRVHMAFIGHPVVGDTVYGRRKKTIRMKRHFLHAARITFLSPASDEPILVEAPLPEHLKDVLAKLR